MIIIKNKQELLDFIREQAKNYEFQMNQANKELNQMMNKSKMNALNVLADLLNDSYVLVVDDETIHRTMDYFDWANQYEPKLDGDDLIDYWNSQEASADAIIKATQENRIWTLVDTDSGDTVIVSGKAFVNRLAYYITEKPWEINEQIDVT